MSTKAEKAALKAYPPKRKEVSMSGAIYTVVRGDFERRIFKEGYEQAEKDLGWHSVDESLPPIDEEVIVLLADYGDVRVNPIYKIAFGHIVDKEAIVDVDGKHYKPESHSGWNIPGVRYWMPCPEIPEE